MHESQRKRIEDVTINGYSFPIKQYLREGWEIYKQNAIFFIGFLFLVVIISLFLSTIPIVGTVAYSLVVGPALVAGFYIVSDRMKRQQFEGFGDFFKGFEYAKPLALISLATYLILFVVFLPSIFEIKSSGILERYAVVPGNPLPPPPDLEVIVNDLSASKIGLILLNLLPVIYLAVAFSWAPLFAVFHHLNFWEALETSRKIITREWFAVFGLFLAMMGLIILPGFLLIGLVGFIPVVGALALVAYVIAVVCIMPFFYCTIYAAFADVTKFLEDDEE
jgi:hypothetical protein